MKPTRLRGNQLIRDLVKEVAISMNDIVYPLFMVEGTGIREEISSLKDQYHLSVDALEKEIPFLKEKGIKYLILFGSPNEKDAEATPAYAKDGIVQQAIRKIKSLDMGMYVITDVCLCQYKSDGHCCKFHPDGTIDLEASLELLSKVALSHAEAGADMVAPSDMMDGRIGNMRETLDENGFGHVPIMSYSAKYASNYYGPFREAANSAPAFGDRRAYQMDYANREEAMREMELDVMEGADILMVKPAMPYLDILRTGKDTFNLPMAAYQVSGEYAMLRLAVDQGIVDEKAILESLIAIKRSGADIIITYFAKEIVRLLEVYN
ncbi:MAG: porphobilinogen synthase [Clostridia bacterium]|nr:porphobilinogen synthase [Clostridia bacterium]